LAKSKIVDSTKGPAGGFQIEPQNIDKIKLSQIVYALDGDNIYNGCGLGLEECNANEPCPLHDKFAHVRDELKAMLQNTTLYELATGLEVGLTYLKR
jgi:Rrf2 family protein